MNISRKKHYTRITMTLVGKKGPAQMILTKVLSYAHCTKNLTLACFAVVDSLAKLWKYHEIKARPFGSIKIR